MRRDLLVIFQFLSFLGWLYLLLQLLFDGYRVLNGEPVQTTLVGGPEAPCRTSPRASRWAGSATRPCTWRIRPGRSDGCGSPPPPPARWC
ncbi:hypothetical protein Cme02nite_08640 [Catellatospora methionotrophica]|uniref:Uncharacterized protein n=1 Tax=Catellatospora methionotrophica TaxID=121620 RepID=A0A8J3L5K3_9ACTN|nr:hypothetical protein [Catellatospora methionotrophica]GIG12532.1 hypothetical protein Cme02nite_08640 [Catellatospora methionotrophica]